MSFKAIMREAFRRGLVQSEVSTWDQYRKLRGTTSHTYNTGKTQMAFENLPGFPPGDQIPQGSASAEERVR